MSKPIDVDYREMFLFPPSVEDWVESDDPARFIREVVEALDPEEFGLRETAGRSGSMGRPHYSAGLLLKAWLYGYFNGIRSSRALERACRQHIQLIWLLGRQCPDHNTLWRYWTRNRKGLRRVFVRIVRIARQAGVVGMSLHALDGTKIQARCSSRAGAMSDRSQFESRSELESLEREVRRLESEIVEQEKRERGQGRSGVLPKELADAKRLRDRVRAAIEEVAGSRVKRLNACEPQARVMPCGDRKRPGYNAQAVVDAQSGLIVAEQVSNRQNDVDSFTPMLDEARENLGAVAEDTVADKGYRSDRNLGEAAEAGRSVLIGLYKTEGEDADAFHKSRFEYDAQNERVICPLGVELVYDKKRPHRGGGWDKSYRCVQTAQCPAAQLCCRSAEGRNVLISPWEEAVREQRRRQSLAENKEKMAKRKVIVEPVFGDIKSNRGFRRWTHWGLERARAQWSMICAAHNLRRLYRLWAAGDLSLQAC